MLETRLCIFMIGTWLNNDHERLFCSYTTGRAPASLLPHHFVNHANMGKPMMSAMFLNVVLIASLAPLAAVEEVVAAVEVVVPLIVELAPPLMLLLLLLGLLRLLAATSTPPC